jgi:predicted ATPase/Tfp pilus assembly protein PilF
MTQSLVEVVGCAVGGAIAGPPGAITGSIAGKLIALIPGLDELISGVAGNVATDILKSYWQRRNLDDVMQINHDLQTAFRDAVREGLYDLGGDLCFPEEWKSPRDVPDRAVYWRTPLGQAVHGQAQDEICECLRWLAQRIVEDRLLPLEPPADRPAANSEIYLLAATPYALADHFFEQVILPELLPFRELERSFKNHLRTHLLDRTLVQLDKLLKERDKAWRAFNRLILKQLRDDVQQLGQGQQTILERLDQLANEATTTQWGNDLATLIGDFGKLEKTQHESFEAVLTQLRDQHGRIMERFATLLDMTIAVKEDTSEIKGDTSEIKAKLHVMIQRIDKLATVQRPEVVIPHTIHEPEQDFFGRRHEIDELVIALQAVSRKEKTPRIWWIHGLPGVGKTQFAYAVAQEVKDDFPDGRILVDLRGTSDNPMPAGEVLAKVIQAFEPDKPPPTDPADQRARYTQLLQGKRVLIVADNVQDKTQVAPLAPPPQGCGLVILSRRRSMLPGAQIRELPTLERAEAEAWIDSMGLGPYAMRLAQLCGYLPLALRISTTLLQEAPLAQVEHYLEKLKNERLRLSGLQDPDHPELPEYSVTASLELSYEAIDEPARHALRCLGVFITSFEPAAAAKVLALPDDTTGAASEEVLNVLVQRSLLSPDQARQRYHLHDLVRVFALEQLRAAGEETAVRTRHAEYYAEQAEQANDGLLAADQARWLGYLDAEYGNLIAAVEWSQRQGMGRVAARIINSLWRFWTMRGTVGDEGESALSVGRAWLEQVLSSFSTPSSPEEIQLRARALNNLGVIAFSQNDYDRARMVFEENLKNFADDQLGYAATLVNLAMLAEQKGDHDRALAWYQQGLAVFQSLDDNARTASTLHNIGVLKYVQKEYDQARQLHNQSLALRRATNDTSGIAQSLENLGWVALDQNDLPEAKRMFTEALRLSWSIPNHAHIPYCLEGLCDVARAEQQAVWAARLCGAAEKLRATNDDPIQDSDAERYTTMVAAIRAALGDAAFATIKHQGYTAPLEMIVQEALQQVPETSSAA